MGDCIRSGRKNGRRTEKMIDRRNWRLLTKNVVRERSEEDKRNRKGNHGQLTPDDSDAMQENNNNKMQFGTSLV